jgi:hypothetical protein
MGELIVGVVGDQTQIEWRVATRVLGCRLYTDSWVDNRLFVDAWNVSRTSIVVSV